MRILSVTLASLILLPACGLDRDTSPTVIYPTPVPTAIPYYPNTITSPYESNYSQVIYVTPVPTAIPAPITVTQVQQVNTQQIGQRYPGNIDNQHTTMQQNTYRCFNEQQNYNSHLPHRYPQYQGQAHCTLAQAYELSNPGYQYNPYMTGWNGGLNTYNTGVYGQYTNGNQGFPGLNNGQHNGGNRGIRQ